jgi:hypothetical protein
MDPIELARQISESDIGTALRESLILFPLIEGIHLLGLALSFGLIFFTDLRLIGVFLSQVPISRILLQLRRWIFTGFALTFGTGLLLFWAEADTMITNPAFLAKCAAICLGRPGSCAGRRARSRLDLAVVLDARHRRRAPDSLLRLRSAMTPIEIAELLQHTTLGQAMRQAPESAVLGIQIGHVLGLILLLTTLVLINLRLLGWGLRDLPLPQVVRATRKGLWLGLSLAIGSGTLLFLSAPVHYAGNAAFVPKMALLAAALLVQVSLFTVATRRASPGPLLARSTAVLSLTLWFGVGLAGRAIGFV